MQSLDTWPLAHRQQVHGILTDIDDTLTTGGAITPEAFQALVGLREAGIPVVAITGRPIGWSAQLAAHWPLSAVVAENGAVALTPDEKKGLLSPPQKEILLSKIYQQDATTRAANQGRMRVVAQRILAEIPGTQLAQDSPGRETDMAIDHSEFTELPADKIAQVVAMMQSEGMHATVSSIHINGWFGSHDKLSGARWIVRSLWGRDLDAELPQWVYVGDSTNDQVMFAAFTHSVGVANVRRFETQLTHKPRYITPSERGRGFAEMAQSLLAARRLAGA